MAETTLLLDGRTARLVHDFRMWMALTEILQLLQTLNGQERKVDAH